MASADALCCDFCASDILAPRYKPQGSTRGLTVYICGHCGLIQSAPRIARTKDRHAAAVSGGADWGNVRYGKGFRTQEAIDVIERWGHELPRPLSLLDVGSNRGSFAKAFLDKEPTATITAVEPDERYADSVDGLPRTTLVQARTENTAFPDDCFDIVHSCHTIEHLGEAFAALKDHARVLKDGGLLVIDAPNTALLGSEDIVEEWFIDKHLFHFSARTLSRMIIAAGFEIIQHNDPDDQVNLLFVARKSGKEAKTIAKDSEEVIAASDLINRYKATRALNLDALKGAAASLEAMAPKRLALWGAGRLFDLLVREGGFDPTRLSLLIDTHLKKHMTERHGVTLSDRDALLDTEIDAVIVMSRMFAGEIAAQIKDRAPRAQIILYADLLGRARLGRAA
jgi:SAM-dependent methyltransferase